MKKVIRGLTCALWPAALPRGTLDLSYGGGGGGGGGGKEEAGAGEATRDYSGTYKEVTEPSGEFSLL